MSHFVDDPDLLLPAFEPRFGVHRLVKDRGGVYDARIKDGRLSDPPVTSKLDSLRATLLALDPLLVGLIIAGYDPREVVIATSNFGSSDAQSSGYFRASLRSGLGFRADGDWTDATGIVDPGTWYSVVAVRVLTWRTVTAPAVAPVDLDGVASYQRYRRPDDVDGTDRDGWIVLGDAIANWSSTTAANGVPTALREVIAAVEQAAASEPEPGLMRLLNPARWDVPRTRESPVVALIAAAEMIWELHLRGAASLQAFVGSALPDPNQPSSIPAVGLDDPANRFGALVEQLSPNDSSRFRDDIDDELEQRRVLLEPWEGSLPDVLRRLWTTHWALAVMQLHEYGLIDAIPLPAPTPPAIPVLDLTGYYTSITDATGEPIASMQINQAGDELRGFWVDSLLGIWPITGQFDDDALANGQFRWTITSTFDGSTGAISHPQLPTTDPTVFGVHVAWPTEYPWSMARRDRRARVDPTDVVAQLGQPANAAALEPLMIPIHRSHRDRIVLLGYELFEKISNASGLADAGLAVDAMDDSIVAMAIAKDLAIRNDDGSFELTPLLVRVRVEIAHFLARRPVPEADGRDAWSQFVELVRLWPAESGGLRALFGIDQGHSYEFTMSGAGREIGAGVILGGSIGGYGIASKFTHKAACAATEHHDPNWSDWYSGAMAIGGPSLSLGGGANVVFAFHDFGTNDLLTVDEWTRDDFLCTFVTGEFAVGLGGYGPYGAEGGYEPWEGYTFFRERDGATASGAGGGWYVEGGMGAKVGVGGSLVGMWGFYAAREGSDGSEPPPPPPPPSSATIEVRGADSATAYFAVDSAVLTDEGKRLIKNLALDYRPLLDDSGSYLIIEGHASRTAPDEHNLDLSRRRVLAMYDYLQSLLTSPAIGSLGPSSALAIRDSHIILTAHGESRPDWAGLPDEVENADWRRATILVTGRYVSSFHVAGVLVAPEPGP